MPLEFQLLSLIELRHYVRQLNERAHPGFVFRIWLQCMYQINVGLSWRQIGISESDVLLLLHICHRNQVIHELRAILAKNEYTPLNFDDAEKLSYILDEIERCHIDWHKLPVSKNVLIEIIDVAACGYEHCCQQTA